MIFFLRKERFMFTLVSLFLTLLWLLHWLHCTILPNGAMTRITGMSLQTKENYFMYLSSFSRTVYREIEELKECQMVISKDMVFAIGGILFSTFVSHLQWRHRLSGHLLSFECHICFLKQDRIVVRALSSQSIPCNKNSVSKLQLSKSPEISALHPKAALLSLISHTYPSL